MTAVTRQPHRLGMNSTISCNKGQSSYPKHCPLQSSEDSLQFLCHHKPSDRVTTVSAPHTHKTCYRSMGRKVGKMGKNKWRTIVLVISYLPKTYPQQKYKGDKSKHINSSNNNDGDFYHALIALSTTHFTMATHRSKNHRSTRSKWERGTQHKQE